MGRLSSEDMIEHTDVDTALSWHLTCNHYPPVPVSMLPVCKAAIKAYNAGGADVYQELELPVGVKYKGRTTAPIFAIIEQHHLDSFLHVDEE